MATTALVKRVLALREDSSARAALRRGGIASSAHYAYPYLASWWVNTPAQRAPVLLFAALCADNPRLKDGSESLGSALFRLGRSGQIQAESLERRMRSWQNAALPQLGAGLRPVLGMLAASNIAVSWDDVYWTLSRWDARDPTQRRNTRRKLLEHYYASDQQDITPPTKESTS